MNKRLRNYKKQIVWGIILFVFSGITIQQLLLVKKETRELIKELHEEEIQEKKEEEEIQEKKEMEEIKDCVKKMDIAPKFWEVAIALLKSSREEKRNPTPPRKLAKLKEHNTYEIDAIDHGKIKIIRTAMKDCHWLGNKREIGFIAATISRKSDGDEQSIRYTANSLYTLMLVLQSVPLNECRNDLVWSDYDVDKYDPWDTESVNRRERYKENKQRWDLCLSLAKELFFRYKQLNEARHLSR